MFEAQSLIEIEKLAGLDRVLQVFTGQKRRFINEFLSSKGQVLGLCLYLLIET